MKKKILFAVSFGMSVVVFNVAYGSQGSNAYPQSPSSMTLQTGQYTQQYPQNPQISHSMKVQTVSNAQQIPQSSYSCAPRGDGYGAHPSVSSGSELSPQLNRYAPPPLPGKYNALSAPRGNGCVPNQPAFGNRANVGVVPQNYHTQSSGAVRISLPTQRSYSFASGSGGYGEQVSVVDVTRKTNSRPRSKGNTPPPRNKGKLPSAPGDDNSHIEQTMPAQIELHRGYKKEIKGNLRSIVEDLRCRIPYDQLERNNAGYVGADVKISSKRPLTEDDIGKVVEITVLCGFLCSLDMSNICMDDSKVKFFVDRLISEITSGKYIIGARWGDNLRTVDVLDLSNNNITDVGCQYLQKLRPYVLHLHLHKNAGIGDNGKRLLEDVFNNYAWGPYVCFDEESHNRENVWQE